MASREMAVQDLLTIRDALATGQVGQEDLLNLIGRITEILAQSLNGEYSEMFQVLSGETE